MQIQVLTDDIWHSLEVYLMSGSNVLYIQCEFKDKKCFFYFLVPF